MSATSSKAPVTGSKKVPQRSCVACRTQGPRAELLRFVRKPDGQVCLDESMRAVGRGAWVCRDARCVEDSFKRGRLSSALRTKINDGDAQILKEACTHLLVCVTTCGT